MYVNLNSTIFIHNFHSLIESHFIPVSILIPVFNKLKYLNRSLDSVQNQTLKNIEIVAIDDFSTDNSSTLILEKMKTDSRIKLIQHNYNQGTCLSRMHGVFSSKGNYIISLDADDLIYANTSELAYKIAVDLTPDVIDMRYELRHKSHIIKNWQPCKRNYTNINDLHKIFTNYIFAQVNWNLARKFIKTTIYKHSMLFLLPFVETKRICQAEDLLHCGVIFLFSKNFYCSHIPIYIYYFLLGDSSGTYQSQMQHRSQLVYVKSLLNYFYKNKNNLFNVTLESYLKDNNANIEIYRNVSNFIKTNSVCNFNFSGFSIVKKTDYCIITRNLI